jgi:hypothetical protein
LSALEWGADNSRSAIRATYRRAAPRRRRRGAGTLRLMKIMTGGTLQVFLTGTAGFRNPTRRTFSAPPRCRNQATEATPGVARAQQPRQPLLQRCHDPVMNPRGPLTTTAGSNRRGSLWLDGGRRSFVPTPPEPGFQGVFAQVCLLPAKGGSSILSRSCPPWIELSCLVLSVFSPRLWHISSVHERRCRPLAQALRIDCKLPIVCLEALTCLTDTCGHAAARAARRCLLSVRETSG